jgi:RNA polymerase sigma-70 factor (ECF subfamily)
VLAQQMEISFEACKKRLQRARALVAECLKRKGVLSRSEEAS